MIFDDLVDCVVIWMNLVRQLIGLKLVLKRHWIVNIIRILEASHRTYVTQERIYAQRKWSTGGIAQAAGYIRLILLWTLCVRLNS